MRQTYPDAGRVIDEHLTPAGRVGIDEMSGQCVLRAIASDAFRPTSDILTVPLAQLAAEPAVAAALAESGLDGSAPTVPVYVYSGVLDEIIPIATVDTMVDRYCHGGTPVTYRRDGASLHATPIVTGASDALNWLRSRIDGAPAAPGCDTRTVTSTVQESGAADTYLRTNSGVVGTLLGVPVGPRQPDAGPRRTDGHRVRLSVDAPVSARSAVGRVVGRSNDSATRCQMSGLTRVPESACSGGTGSGRREHDVHPEDCLSPRCR